MVGSVGNKAANEKVTIKAPFIAVVKGEVAEAGGLDCGDLVHPTGVTGKRDNKNGNWIDLQYSIYKIFMGLYYLRNFRINDIEPINFSDTPFSSRRNSSSRPNPNHLEMECYIWGYRIIGHANSEFRIGGIGAFKEPWGPEGTPHV